MQKFTDSLGREWQVRINLTVLERVHADTGVDLTLIFDPESKHGRAMLSEIKAFAVLRSVLHTQLQERGVSGDQLGEALDSEEIAEASALALQHAVIDFFRGQKRDVIRKAMDKALTTTRRLRTQAFTAVDQALDEMDLDAVLNPSAATAGESPGSSASTPDPAPPAN